MKKLIVVIMSLNLILTPVVFAQGAPTCDHTMTPESGMAKVKDQAKTLAISSVGANIMLNCALATMQPSLIVFSAGSITHIATEIAAGNSMKRLQEQNNQELERLEASMVEGGDLQKASIEKQLEDENSKLDFVKKRIRWLNIVKALYISAGVIAVAEFAREVASLGTWSSMGGCIGNEAPALLTRVAIVGAYTYQNASDGGLLGSLLFLFIPIHARIVPALYNHALARAATFTASGAIVADSVNGLEEIQGKIECRIAKMESLLARFNRESESDNELNETGGASGGGDGGQNGDKNQRKYELKKLAEAARVNRQCVSNSGKGITVSSNCSRPIKISRPKFDANFQIPSLKNFANSSADLADALAQGDIGRAEMIGDGLLAGAGRMDALKKDLLKKANDKLKAQGKKAIDFDKEVKDRVASLTGDFNKAAQSSNGSLASFGGEAALGDDLKSADSLKDGSIGEITTEGSNQPAAVTDSAITEDFSLDETASGEGANLAQTPTLEESLSEFETNENDISKNSDVSIFKQVSNRYFLNYTKFFQRKVIDPPLAEPQATNK